MRAALAAESALQLYRTRASLKPLPSGRVILPEGFTPNLKAAEASWLEAARGVSAPVQCCVAADEHRRSGKLLGSLVMPENLPKDAFIHLGKELYIASPELALIQLSARVERLLNIDSRHLRQLAVVTLAYLGSELASNFAYVLNSEGDFASCAQRLDVARLASLASTHSSFHGRKHLLEAVPYMIGQARSPAEIQLALFASLPKKLGGRGLPLPVLNQEAKVKNRRALQKRFPDLLLPGGVVLEYNGGYHEGERANEDDTRRNELIAAGYTVLVVNKEQLQDAKLLDQVFDTVERVTGSLGRRPSGYEELRGSMRSLLFELAGTRYRENTGRLACDCLKPPSYPLRTDSA